jgi:hypothetical protein
MGASMLVVYVPDSYGYYNQDNVIWGSSIASAFSFSTSISLQPLFHDLGSFEAILSFLGDLISTKKITHILYFPGYCDVEWTHNVIIPLKLGFQSTVALTTFLLDELIGFSSHFRYLSFYSDAVVSTELVNQGFYESIGCKFTFFNSSYPELEHKIIEPTPRYQYDIAFIGDLSAKHNRRRYIEFLQGSFPSFFLAGAGSPIGIISKNAYYSAISKSRITLNFSGTLTNSLWLSRAEGTLRYGQNKGRILESILLGSAPISEYSYTSQKLFGNNLLHFSSLDQLSDAISQLLSSPAELQSYRLNLIDFARNHLLHEIQVASAVNMILSLEPAPSRYPSPTIEFESIQQVRSLYHYFNNLRSIKSLSSLSCFFRYLVLNFPPLLFSLLLYLSRR